MTLAFGTRGFPKRWFPEEETWPALARLLQARGLGVVLLGGRDECELGHRIAVMVPGCLDLTGQTSIPEACALQYGAAGNVGLDTGLIHTAAATGRPTVMVNSFSPEPLIQPLGPLAISVRGSFLDTQEHPSPDVLVQAATSHRIPPVRIMNVLEAMMAEGKTINRIR